MSSHDKTTEHPTTIIVAAENGDLKVLAQSLAVTVQTDEAAPRPVAIVTGATGGMGTEIVAALATDHLVVALGRDREKLETLVNRHPGHVVGVVVDLVAELDSPAFFTAIAQAVPKVAVVVHAAAIAQRFSVDSAEVSDWRSHMDINVVAPAELTRVLLPALRKAEGTVVFINSGAGRNGYGDNVIYAATKHALYALADSLRKAERDVRVSTVAPGPTDTPMLAGLQDYDPSHVIAPVEVARAVRAVIDAGPSTQLTEVQVRPRIELDQRA
ncbi:MAG: SDR family oxidoreductase [Corynebacterium sp.]|nr:SDR family oxidoreductase [Corynebacterium sp.]